MLEAKEVHKLQTLLKKGDSRLPIVFNALGDARRCKIFRSLLRKERLCVSDIAKTLGISMSLASQHLKVLEITRLVVREREGRSVYFRPNEQDDLVRAISKAVR